MKFENLGSGRAKVNFEVEINGNISHSIKKDISSNQKKTDGDSGKESEEYYIRKFRLLSKNIVRGLGYPIDYTKENLLSTAVEMFNKTIFKDHRLSVENWVGLVKNATYNQVTNPPGIDAELWIDKTISDNKKLIRGIKTGAINRCSVTISFLWNKSHPKMKDHIFFESLGQIIDGSEVRIIVKKIEEVYETSLVWWGADDTAKTTEGQQKKNSNNKFSHEHGKEVTLEILENVKQKLTSLFGIEISAESEIGEALETLSANLQKKKEEVQRLNRRVTELKMHESTVQSIREKLKERILRLHKIVEGEDISELTKQVIDKSDIPQLETFEKDLAKKQNKLFPYVCQECKSQNVERRSSKEVIHQSQKKSNENESKSNEEMKTIH